MTSTRRNLPKRRSAKPDGAQPVTILSGESNTERDRGPSPRKVAMDYLARREHTQAELCAKLIARDVPPEDAADTVARLAEEGLVSDARFAEAFTSARARKGQGPVRVRAELEQRGLEAGLIDAVLAQAGLDWAALAGSVRVKKYGARAPSDFRERARQMRFLQYRGFTAEQIRLAMGGGEPD